MLLTRIHLDPRNRRAHRDLADPYQMHATLCRAFAGQDKKCPPGSFLWRLETETDAQHRPRLLVQSAAMPNWEALGIAGWLAG
ncbi:MAG: type I-E CRISPR-associated protein Cas6/Cse3/CasE [Methylococcaceae bacterium]|jgi:CRISPR system Cascade subunit CasE